MQLITAFRKGKIYASTQEPLSPTYLIKEKKNTIETEKAKQQKSILCCA
jgi:hypothetical protein